MNWYNWLIVIIPFAGVLYMAFYTRKYIRGMPDFLAGGWICDRYLLSVGSMESGLSVMVLIAFVAVHYRTGFSYGFWSGGAGAMVLGGETTELPLSVLFKKHLKLIGSTLRSRSDAEKSEILKELVKRVCPQVSAGAILPVINQVFPMEKAAEAYQILAQQKNIGKVILPLP